MDSIRNFLKELYEFSHHHNQTIADILSAHREANTDKAVRLFSHMVNAHHIWVSRINSHKALYGVWEILPVAKLRDISRDNFDQTLHILDSVDLSMVVAYTNTQGNSYKNTVKDILFHVVNHTTYHRGQIALELRQVGITPPVTDFIAYKR
ncbi:MAG: DinB family protein [Cyclobacteriaceae bacterium]|nr:DinB family protein [Cyclobacteriaceae bacterium]